MQSHCLSCLGSLPHTVHTNDTSHILARIVTRSSWSKAFWVSASSWARGPWLCHSSSCSLDTSNAHWTLSCKRTLVSQFEKYKLVWTEYLTMNESWFREFGATVIFAKYSSTLSICSWDSSTDSDCSSLSHPHNLVNTACRENITCVYSKRNI